MKLHSPKLYMIISMATFVGLSLVTNILRGPAIWIGTKIWNQLAPDPSSTSAYSDHPIWLVTEVLETTMAFFVGIFIGIVVWIIIATLWKESVGEKKLAMIAHSEANEPNNVSVQFEGYGLTANNIRYWLKKAHSGNIIVFETDEEGKIEPSFNEIKNSDEKVINTMHLLMNVDKPGDAYQRGQSIEDLSPDDGDIGLPSDLIIEAINDLEGSTYYQTVVAVLPRGRERAGEVEDQIENGNHMHPYKQFVNRWVPLMRHFYTPNSELMAENRARRKRLDESSNKYLTFAVRLININDASSEVNSSVFKNEIEGVVNAVQSMAPEHVSIVGKFGSTASDSLLEQHRVEKVIEDFQNRSLNITPPSWTFRNGDCQGRENLIFDAEVAQGLLLLPGAGRKETRESLEIVPMEDWPTEDLDQTVGKLEDASDYDSQKTTEPQGGSSTSKSTDTNGADSEDKDDDEIQLDI